ncbi:MAG: AraC family transcriptional regulator [Spirochaetia bacterium]
MITKETIQVKGMCCSRCIRALKEEMVKLSPARLSIHIGEVEVEYDPQLISRQHIESAIEDAGFEVMTLLREKKVEEAKNYVREHLSEPEVLRLSVIARALATSPFHLSRTFSLNEGETLQDFIMRLRMERAAQLLQETEKTVLDICGEVGLSSPSHFTKEFKKRFGRTPLAYRKSPGANPGLLHRFGRGSASVVARVEKALQTRFPHSHGRH